MSSETSFAVTDRRNLCSRCKSSISEEFRPFSSNSTIDVPLSAIKQKEQNYQYVALFGPLKIKNYQNVHRQE